MGMIGATVGWQLGKRMYAPKLGAKAAEMATEAVTHPKVSSALSQAASRGGVTGAAANYIAKNPDAIVEHARQAAMMAAPYIGAQVGNRVTQRADQAVGRVANMTMGAVQDSGRPSVY